MPNIIQVKVIKLSYMLCCLLDRRANYKRQSPRFGIVRHEKDLLGRHLAASVGCFMIEILVGGLMPFKVIFENFVGDFLHLRIQ